MANPDSRALELLKTLSGHPPATIEDLAARLGRPAEQVRYDVDALSLAGVIDREGVRISFPFDAVHVDFTLRAAA